MDLPFVYDEYGQLVKHTVGKKVKSTLTAAGKQYLSGNILGAVTTLSAGLSSSLDNSNKSKMVKKSRESLGDVIMFSGCKDLQTSADTNVKGMATGAMSYAFITTMTENPHQTYTMLLSNLRRILRGKYSQKPQMSTGRPMDMNSMFIM
jgi:hypothetical protein